MNQGSIMNDKILFVDDEARVLDGIKRTLRRQFHIETANSGAEALTLVESQGPYAVIVSDMRMPGMSGVELLAMLKKRVPDTVRMMLTGNADQQTAIDAVNKGDIFRFLTKPCEGELLASTVTAALNQHQLITAEKVLLEKTLSGSIRALIEVLSLVNPEAFGRSARIRSMMRKIGQTMELPDMWRMEIIALVSQIGFVTLPDGILKQVSSGQMLSGEDSQLYEMHPQVGAELLSKIPRMEQISESIKYQEKHYDGSGLPPDGVKGLDIPLGARLLKVILDYDQCCSILGMSRAQSENKLRQQAKIYDPDILAALQKVLAAESAGGVFEVSLPELIEGMILAKDIKTRQGALVICKGQEITPSVQQRLASFQQGGQLQASLMVSVTLNKTAGATEPQRTANLHNGQGKLNAL